MKPDISLSRIATFLAGRYSRVENFHQLEEGEESLACSATVDGQHIVVRVNRTREGFEKDAFIAGNWPALRAPRVLSIEPVSDAWLCVSDKVPGSTLQALGMQAGACGREIVRLLDTMAAIDTSHITGYGRCDASGRGPFPSWRDFMVSVDGPEDLVGFVRDHPYRDHRGLVHGDFGSNNVLAENGRITGVIDWSEAMIGDTLYDTANLFFWRPWLSCMEAQCRYMETHTAGRLRERETLLRYQVRIGLQVAAEARAEGDTKMEAWALERSRVIRTGA